MSPRLSALGRGGISDGTSGSTVAKNSTEPNRVTSVLNHFDTSHTFCCQCGGSFHPSHGSAFRPLGRVQCRSCEHSACVMCTSFSPYVKKCENLVELPPNKKHRPTYGFVCCKRGCGWSQALSDEPNNSMRVSDGSSSNFKRGAYSLLTKVFRPAVRRNPLILDFRQYSCVAEPKYPGSRCGHACCDDCIKFKMADGDPDESTGTARNARSVGKGPTFQMAPGNASFRPCKHLGHGMAGLFMNCQVSHEDDDDDDDDDDDEVEGCGYDQFSHDQHNPLQQALALVPGSSTHHHHKEERPEQLLPVVERAIKLQRSRHLSRSFEANSCAVSSSSSLAAAPAPAIPPPTRDKRNVNEPPQTRQLTPHSYAQPVLNKPVLRPPGPTKKPIARSPRTRPPNFTFSGNDIDAMTLSKLQTAMIGVTISSPAASSFSTDDDDDDDDDVVFVSNRVQISNAQRVSANNMLVPPPPLRYNEGSNFSVSCGSSSLTSGVSSLSSPFNRSYEAWSPSVPTVSTSLPQGDKVSQGAASTGLEQHQLPLPRKSRFAEHIQSYRQQQAEELERKNREEGGGVNEECTLRRQGARKAKVVKTSLQRGRDVRTSNYY